MSGIGSDNGVRPSPSAALDAPRIPRSAAIWHALQGVVVALVFPLWGPAMVLYLRFVRGHRVRDLSTLRAEFARIRSEGEGPLLICANHLTLVDSLLVAWALGNPLGYAVHWKAFPWNTPEVTNFAQSPRQALIAYLAKCIPIARGGRREETGAVLDRVTHLLARGETALIFPEGGRSRSGRVDPESAAWGVGRIVGKLPGCRVACVYLRGDAQESWSDWPARGDTFTAKVACIEPKSDHRGARRSRDIARQITVRLVQMEGEYFDGRQ